MIRCGICGKIKDKDNHWWVCEFSSTNKVSFSYPMGLDVYDISPDLIKTQICSLEHLNLLESRIRSGDKEPLRMITV